MTSGTGKGTVTGPGINCPPDCVQVFPLPSGVSLKVHPGKRSNFAHWGGACRGKKGCSISMSADRTVNAKFKGPLLTRLRLRAPDPNVAAGATTPLKVKARPCKGRRHDGSGSCGEASGSRRSGSAATAWPCFIPAFAAGIGSASGSAPTSATGRASRET